MRSLEIKVSIIIPVFNVEKFLEQCVVSAMKQTLKEIEIICVNDGSTDESLNILTKLALSDPRIKIINKSNSGYGDTINIGIKEASGEYVGILESDDFVDEECFEKLYLTSKKYNADVAKANFYLYWGERNEKKYYNNLGIGTVVTNTKKAMDKILCAWPSIWSAIYRRTWLLNNNIKFLPTPGASYQDTSFSFKIAILSRNTVLLPEAHLFYRQDNSSSSVKINTFDKCMMVNKECDESYKFIEEHKLFNYLGRYYMMCIKAYCWNLRRMEEETRFKYLEIINNEIKKSGKSWNFTIVRVKDFYFVIIYYCLIYKQYALLRLMLKY